MDRNIEPENYCSKPFHSCSLLYLSLQKSRISKVGAAALSYCCCDKNSWPSLLFRAHPRHGLNAPALTLLDYLSTYLLLITDRNYNFLKEPIVSVSVC